MQYSNTPRLRKCLHYRFFERTSHEGPNLLPVHPMSSDGHQVASGRHDITQQGQVTVVDVGTVKGDDVVQLFLNGLSNCFNSKNLMDQLKSKNKES